MIKVEIIICNCQILQFLLLLHFNKILLKSNELYFSFKDQIIQYQILKCKFNFPRPNDSIKFLKSNSI